MRYSFLLLAVGFWLTVCNVTAQNEPTVVTDSRYARGATMAFGRIKSAKSNNDVAIQSRGFCCATNANPTYDDIRSSKTLSNNGTIYCLQDLEPATLYYMRAYAVAKDGCIGYGDVIKFYTLPKGEVTYWYNNGGDQAANNRINNAATQACQIFSDLTSIKKKFDIDYSAGTPTADCSYQDQPWINMGASSSYQRTGTLMHEMQHGLGVINYSTQWCGDIMRSGSGRGDWLGERVSAFLDFWDNTTDSYLHGDDIHMWPYGVNGAHEDDGRLETYYANAMIGQALGEDGLQHRSNTFAEPCYVFNQEDTIKYYIKNEDTDRGLYSAFLIAIPSGSLRWKEMTTEQAVQNDSAAWYITFTPNNQYYQLRNAATGQYMTFESGFKTKARTTLTANDNFHLMKGRVGVGSGTSVQRGYWLIHPSGDWSPKCLAANVNGATAQQTFDLSNNATKQRWLILTSDEIKTFEDDAVVQLKAEVNNTLAPIKALADVPHTCTPSEADQTFANAISSIEQTLAAATSPSELTPLSNEAWLAAQAFLNAATPTNAEKPFDLTFLIKNAGMDAADGWSVAPAISYSCGEFYEKTFNMKQTFSQMPLGTYRLKMQGFQRPGSYTDAYNDWAAGNNKVNAQLYIGTKTVKIAHIADCAQTKRLGGTEQQVGGRYYVPDNMEAASKYFAKGLYENSLYATVSSPSISIGLRSTSMPSRYWCIFDNFRLQFFGTMTEQEITGIDNVGVNENQNQNENQNVYDLQGCRVLTPHTSSSSFLKKGLYIINGKKTVIR